jgi:predicted nuclease of predicted toxin-antitoxin system
MKFLLDQSAERRIAPFLRNLGHDVKVVAVDFPPGILDHEVLTHAYEEQRVVITNDKGDFGELIFKDFHPHAGVILGCPKMAFLGEILCPVFGPGQFALAYL